MPGRSGDRRARPLSYANVVSTLALVIAVSGGSALAAGSLGTKREAQATPDAQPRRQGLHQRQDRRWSCRLRRDRGYRNVGDERHQRHERQERRERRERNERNPRDHGGHGHQRQDRWQHPLSKRPSRRLDVGSIPAGATSSRNALGDYRVRLGRAITGCTIAVSIAGTSVQLGMIGVGVLDANTLQVFTRDSANTVADRAFFVEAICPAS